MSALFADPLGAAVTDADRQRDLRRMKAFAGGLLLAAAVVYVLARRAEDGGPAWVGFVRAAAEAGMVGGLADWFAVTALFRRPLRLPIPHTAIIPTRKDALGASLGDFVGTNFLAEDVVRHRVRQAQVAGRIGTWLDDPAHAERVVAEAAVAVRGALAVLRDEDVQDLLEHTVVRPLAALPVGPPLGRVLDRVVADGAHHGLVDIVLAELETWVRANRDVIVELVISQAPTWAPTLVNELIGARVHAELVRWVAEVRADTDHSARQALDRYLRALASDLRTDPATMARADALKDRLLAHDEMRTALRTLWASMRRVLLEAVDDPDSDLRRRAALGLRGLGQRLGADAGLRAKVDAWLESALAYVAVTYRDELTSVITDTVERWDATDTSRRIELRVGRDLQFIRVNGTVVGALAGLAIHTVGRLIS